MKKRNVIVALIFCICFLQACKEAPPKVVKELSADQIMKKAHEKAGGDFWANPKSLHLMGHGKFYNGDSVFIHEKHNMWRVYEDEKSEAHAANGKVRIESFRNGEPVFVVTFDGQNTYDLNGKQEASDADKRWASNFGYGVIRHAFDKGYKLERIEDGKVKDKDVYQIAIIDPTGSRTNFGIQKEDFLITMVAFDTPRGWHERIYSEFFTKAAYTWQQSGRVELFYNGKISNEIFWSDFTVNETLADSLFVIN